MYLLRMFLPVKFSSRLVLLSVSVFLSLTVMVFWNLNTSTEAISSNIPSSISKIIKVPSRSKTQIRNVGSANLILPGPVVVEPEEEADVPKMYKAYQEDPRRFADNWKIAMPTRVPRKRAKSPGKPKGNQPEEKKKRGDEVDPMDGTPRVNCVINNQTTVTCMRASKTGEVYMPFKFIEKYFQVYGEFVNQSIGSNKHRKGTFHFHHSNALIWPVTAKYNTTKEFLFFGNYDVEGRSRVMLISGVHGVPVSNQWNKAGHIYPIQVSQYGLSHYSKLLTEEGRSSDTRKMIEDGTGASKWKVPIHTTLNSTKDGTNSIIYFNSLGSSDYPSLEIEEENIDSCLSFNVKFISKAANVSVLIAASEGLYVLTYQSEQMYKTTRGDSMVYGIGDCKQWCTLHRDVMVDFKKFASGLGNWSERKATLTSIARIEVGGEGHIDNVTISHKCHEGHFKDASDWLVKGQDSNGGWPVGVERIITTQRLSLPPGWYSAMGQGQAISLLVRAYITYKESTYLSTAVKGLSIYQNLSAHHGVVARFMNKYNWYEEYPTQPPLFVLNGFIYSLFGLYDLIQVAEGGDKQTAQRLFDDGMTSLKAMLPFFDSGTGTFYDLRHYTIPGIAPNRARWDYHAVHIAQLQYLGTLDSDPIFNATAARWLGYVDGKWAPHN